jgi:stage II sporulation protein AB (anti-sigma F factor)
MLNNYLKLEFPSLPPNVGLSRLVVATFASQLEFTLAEIEEIRVAISEAVSNCVIHAYPQNPGIVELSLTIEEGFLITQITDFGRGIENIEQAKQATFSTEPERMGLGLVFMESFMDEMVLSSRPQEGTTVIMKKRPERGLADVGISRSN